MRWKKLKEKLEREFILRLSDNDIVNKGVNYAHIIVNSKPNLNQLYRIVGKTENGYILIPSTYEFTEANIEKFGKVYNYDEVIDYSDKSSYDRSFSAKEEIFDEMYAQSILFNNVSYNLYSFPNSVLTKCFFKIVAAFESTPDNVSDVICLTKSSNKMPVFLYFECLTIIPKVFYYKYIRIITL